VEWRIIFPTTCSTLTYFSLLFFSKYRPSPPHYNIVVSTGTANWAQFHHTLEGVAAPLELSDVAKTVWNKLP